MKGVLIMKKIITNIGTLLMELLSASPKISSMRVVFVLGTFFTLGLGAFLTNKVVNLLAIKPEGMAVLAVVLGAIFGGVIGIIGALAGTKALQTKFEEKVGDAAIAVVNSVAPAVNKPVQ
jgi:hypothetical protein